MILLSGLIILFTVFSFSMYSYIQQNNKNKAIAMLTETENIKDQKTQMQRLVEIEGTLPSNMVTAVAMALGNYNLQQNEFQNAREQYNIVSKTKDAIHIIGILGEAKTLIQLKQPLEAIAILKPLTQGLPDDITSLILLTLAEAQEDANLLDDAIKTYTRVASIDTNSYGYIQHKLYTLTAANN